ncbi:MAG: SsrA-binding protein SmpB [Chlorobi bacterium]|nr:SsrA-binding protein SmpB [Chlorobiota bacterium]
MPKTAEKNITSNRKAFHEYFITQKIEAGISLLGTEVKALRTGKANLVDAYAAIKNGEVWLVNAHIGFYDHGNINNHEPLRKRKLLLKKSEIKKLTVKLNEKGFTLIPLRLYFSNGKVKVELGLAHGKKSYDKREAIAKRDAQRDLDRRVKL